MDNVWSEKTLSLVNWKAHRGVLNEHDKNCKQITKHTHKQMPTAKQARQCDKLTLPDCPFECGEIKNQDHVLSCPHPTRKDDCKTLLRRLRAKCDEMKTDPSVKDLPLQGAERHFKGWPENERHNKCQRILQSQNMIGWEQMLKGRMSKEWEKNCDKCARINKDADKNVSGLKWTINIIDETWKWFLNEWQERNDKMHGEDKITRAQ